MDRMREADAPYSTACSKPSADWYRKTYPLTFKGRAEKQETLEKRYDQAWQVARQAADLLKSSFEAQRVVVFGSLIHRTAFTQWSDIDLAAWGIPVDRFYNAVAALTDLSRDFKIDLVAPDTDILNDRLRKHIEEEGIGL